MKDNILSTSGKAFQRFISNLTEKLPKPKAKFITDVRFKFFERQRSIGN